MHPADQFEAFAALGPTIGPTPWWQRQPFALRECPTEWEIDAYRHPLVRFVGLDTYEAAAGAIVTIDRTTVRCTAGEAERRTGAGCGPRHGRMMVADHRRLLQAHFQGHDPASCGRVRTRAGFPVGEVEEGTLLAKPSGWPMAPPGCSPSSRPKARRKLRRRKYRRRTLRKMLRLGRFA